MLLQNTRHKTRSHISTKMRTEIITFTNSKQYRVSDPSKDRRRLENVKSLPWKIWYVYRKKSSNDKSCDKGWKLSIKLINEMSQ